jgi:gas vesicle protein
MDEDPFKKSALVIRSPTKSSVIKTAIKRRHIEMSKGDHKHEEMETFNVNEAFEKILNKIDNSNKANKDQYNSIQKSLANLREHYDEQMKQVQNKITAIQTSMSNKINELEERISIVEKPSSFNKIVNKQS